jgi:hypothetical protein
MNLSDELFKKLNEIIPENSYPKNKIVPMPKERLKGTAFFGGGDGIYKEGKFNLQKNYDVMFLGQDYDNEFNFNKSSGSEIEDKNYTWNNLKKILDEINCDKILFNSFFTNCIQGLRFGKTKNTGTSVAFQKRNSSFLKLNQAFFKQQLKLTKPTLIVGLGANIPRFIGSTFPKQFPRLETITSFKKLDETNFRDGISLNYKGGNCKVIFITHPALYFSNVVRRKGSKEFENKMIRDAFKIVQ